MNKVRLVSITHVDEHYIIRIYRENNALPKRYNATNPDLYWLIRLIKNLEPFKVSVSFGMSVWFLPK